MIRYFIIFSLVASSLAQPLFAQVQNRVRGEFIIHASNTKAVDAFRQQILQSRSDSGIAPSFRQIMQQPLSLWLFSCSPEENEEAAWNTILQAYDGFEGVYPNRRVQSRGWPDDPEVNRQWQYNNPGGNGGVTNADIDMDLAWDLTTGGITPSGDSIVICIIDDGINGTHEDMQANLWINRNEIPGNGIDDDANGYVDDTRGWNVTTDSDDVYTGGGHGTPVAGVAGARGNNNIGISGVNWHVKLMIVNYGSPTEANALASYGYAYTMRKMYNHTGGKKGAFVVATNASWGIDKTKAEEAPLWCALYDSLGTVGILSCGATTNTDTDVDVEGDLPTSCESNFLISVTNMNRANTRVTSAGYGAKSIDLGAYGKEIYTVTRTGYGSFGGTSGATPHVTGVIGLLYALPCAIFDSLAHHQPSQAALIAKNAILYGAQSNQSLQQITTTGGVLNAYKTLQHAQSLCEPCTTSPLGVILKPQDTSIQISWAEQPAYAVAVRYRKAGQDEWSTIMRIQPDQLLEQLDVCTEYEIQLASSCASNDFTFGVSNYVSTTGCCKMPAIESLTADSAAISFSVKAQPDAEVRLTYTLDMQEFKDTILTEPFFYLAGLPACQAVSFQLQARCTTYNNVSDTSRLVTTSTPCGNCTLLNYCIFSKKDDTQEWLASFDIAGTTTKSGSSGQGYTSQAGVTQIELVPDNTYPFSIQIGYAASPFPDFFNLFLDLNQDGIFQKEERLYNTPAPITEGIHGTIQIPANASEGYTRMRLILSYEKMETACDEEQFTYGEVEDYCVYISGRSCPFDANIKWLSSDKESLFFAVEHQNETQDTVLTRYRVSGSSTWSEVLSIDSIVIAGLQECTLYEVEFRSSCGSVFSMPSARDTFRTACSNQTIDVTNSLLIWPNPAMQEIALRVPFQSSPFRFTIVDQLGRQTTVVARKGSNNEWKFDISHLPEGIFHILMHQAAEPVLRATFIKTE